MLINERFVCTGFLRHELKDGWDDHIMESVFFSTTHPSLLHFIPAFY